MTSHRLVDVAIGLIAIALLLWAAYGVHANARILRNLFLPVSVVAGMIGLLVGPQGLGPLLDGLTPWAGGLVPDASYPVWSGLPGLLISVVFAALFLGRPLPGVAEIWRSSGPQVFLGYAMSMGQYATGMLLVILVLTPLFGTNPLAGTLLEISMTGGHGTAAGLGDTFEALDFGEGRDLALALATVGLVGGVLLGTLFVNIAMRTVHRSVPAPLPAAPAGAGASNADGGAGRSDAGPAAAPSGGVEALSLQFGFIAAAIVVGIGLQALLVQGERLLWFYWTGALMAYVPLFPLAMIGGVVVQAVLTAVDRAHWIDAGLIARISGTALDFIIVSALATLSLSIIGDQLWPFMLLALTGLAWTSFCLLVLAPRFIPEYWFARGIGDFGQGTGMVVSGLLLMRMADPDGRSGNLERFGYKQLLFEPFVGGGLLTALALPLAAQFGATAFFAWTAGLTLLIILGGLHLGRSLRPRGVRT